MEDDPLDVALVCEALRKQVRSLTVQLHNSEATAKRYKMKLEELRQALKAASDNSY